VQVWLGIGTLAYEKFVVFRHRLEAGEMAGSFPDDYYILENDMPRFTTHLADSNTF